MNRKIKILSLLLCLAVCLSAFCSCGTKSIASLEDKNISVNLYEFLLSRMKGTLAYYGYNVTDESFWKTIVSSDGMTYDEYFRAEMMRQTVHYLIADYLFDKEGLALDSESEKAVDDLMASHLNKAGGKTALNAELKSFGVNYEMLREIYVLEAKMDTLKEHLYGRDGEKIAEEAREAYLAENYVSFKQIFLATYYYVEAKDRFGDTVYYTDEKQTAIAYDKENGTTKINEYGREITDVLGNPEYFTAEGKIAYDTKGGVVGYVTDDKGEKVIAYYDDKKKGEIHDLAEKYADECDGDIELFEEYIEKYNESDSREKIYLVMSPGYYAAQNDEAAYFDDIAEKLSEINYGETAAFESDFGCHIICKYELEKGVYDKEEHKDAFSTFYQDLISSRFEELCAGYEDMVKVDEKAYGSALTMAEIGINILY